MRSSEFGIADGDSTWGTLAELGRKVDEDIEPVDVLTGYLTEVRRIVDERSQRVEYEFKDSVRTHLAKLDCPYLTKLLANVHGDIKAAFSLDANDGRDPEIRFAFNDVKIVLLGYVVGDVTWNIESRPEDGPEEQPKDQPGDLPSNYHRKITTNKMIDLLREFIMVLQEDIACRHDSSAQ